MNNRDNLKALHMHGCLSLTSETLGNIVHYSNSIQTLDISNWQEIKGDDLQILTELKDLKELILTDCKNIKE